jgi:hypothetical protein
MMSSNLTHADAGATCNAEGAVRDVSVADALLQAPLQRQRQQSERVVRWRSYGERAFGGLAAITVFAAIMHYGPALGLSVPWNTVAGVVLGTLAGVLWPPRRRD